MAIERDCKYCMGSGIRTLMRCQYCNGTGQAPDKSYPRNYKEHRNTKKRK